MTPIDKLKELEAAAHSGNWRVENDVGIVRKMGHKIGFTSIHKDARLICAARNLLPAFLEFVDTMRPALPGSALDRHMKKLEQAIEKEMG